MSNAKKSIILELQQAALSPATKVGDLLRMAYLVAKKLDLEELGKWVNGELNGYKGLKPGEFPAHRKVHGEVKAYNPYHGWQPLIIQQAKIAEKVSQELINCSVAEIEGLIEGNDQFVMLSLSAGLQTELNKHIDMPPTKFALMIAKSKFIGILDHVRNQVLDWALNLEKDGILGEGLSFSKKEKEIAQGHNYTTIFNGPVGNAQVQQSVSNSNQTQLSAEFDLGKLNLLINEVRKHQTDLGDGVVKEIDSIQAELKRKKPNSGIIKSSLASLKTILEGAAGSVVAAELLDLVAQIPVSS